MARARISLVGVAEATSHVDILIDNGKLDEASSVLKKSKLGDHVYPQKTSDARLTYYLAGYVGYQVSQSVVNVS